MNPIVDLVAGARPNFMKLAPVYRALVAEDELEARIVHTGQHYSASMNEVFFRDLALPEPDVTLGVGSGTHAHQTARILTGYEDHLLENPPAATVVFGDVNSTVACALAAVKLGVPVAHVEAGLRSFDRTMPEEVNRVLTDAISSLFLVTEEAGVVNLRREGAADERIRRVGNAMIDTLLAHLSEARSLERAESLGLVPGEYALATLHRPSNVDDPEVLARLVGLLEEFSEKLPIVFPVHPRTSAAAEKAGFGEKLRPGGRRRFLCLEPEPYLHHLSLMAGAAVVLTDSGGMQEETTVLGVPCLTLRENTERPVTIELGTSRLVGNDPARIREAFQEVLADTWPRGCDVPLWDGRAGERIARELADWLSP